MTYGQGYVSRYYRSLILPKVPENFTVAEGFRHGFSHGECLDGIASFRELLYKFFDDLTLHSDTIDTETGKTYDPYGSDGDNGTANLRRFPILIQTHSV